MAKVGAYKELTTVTTALDILDVLSMQKQPMSTSAVADAIAATYVTAKNYLTTLENRKYVRCVGGEWELGQEISILCARRKAKLMATQNSISRELEDV
ncbi:MAG: helix-turn-helix domain-containing protein [Deferribacterales bacterium]